MTDPDPPRRALPPRHLSPRHLPPPHLPLPRRALLAIPPVLALAACAPADEEPPGPEPVEEVGVPVPAPSGQVTAVLDVAGEDLGVMLRDPEGTDFWGDDFPYRPDQPPGLLWETEADVLWVLSDDLGAARIAQDSDGAWSKQSAEELEEEIPEEIASWT